MPANITLGDILSLRSASKLVRGTAALSAVIVSTFYLLGQMVGAGKLMQLLLGIPYNVSVIGVGVLMVLYVTFGGMKATTWVQIIKAFLLMLSGIAITVLLLWKFGFNLFAFYRRRCFQQRGTGPCTGTTEACHPAARF